MILAGTDSARHAAAFCSCTAAAVVPGRLRRRENPWTRTPGILNHDVVHHRRDILRLVGQAHPGNAGRITLVRLEKTAFHCTNRAGGQVTASPATSCVRARPGAPVFLGARRVSRPHVERHLALRGAVFAPPGQASPVRKILASNVSDSKLPSVSYPGPSVKIFPGIGGGNEHFRRRGPATRLVTCADAVLATLE